MRLHARPQTSAPRSVNDLPAKRHANDSDDNDDYISPRKRVALDEEYEDDDEDDDPPTNRKQIVKLKIGGRSSLKTTDDDEETINVAQRKDSKAVPSEAGSAHATNSSDGDLIDQIQGLTTQVGGQLRDKEAEIEKLKGACRRHYNEKKALQQELDQVRQDLEKTSSAGATTATDPTVTAETSAAGGKKESIAKAAELEKEVDRLKGVLRQKKLIVEDATKVLFAQQQKQKLVAAAEKVVALWHADGNWQAFEGVIKELGSVVASART